MVVNWAARLEGMIYGVSLFSISRSLIYTKLCCKLFFVGCLWIVLIFMEAMRSYAATVPMLFIVHVSFFNCWLIILRTIVIWGYMTRVNEHRKRMIIPAYSIFFATSLAFAILLCFRVSCSYRPGNCEAPPPISMLQKADLIANVYYLTLVLSLDCIFITKFIRLLYFKHGGCRALKFRPFIYHLYLQCIVAIFIMLNIYRILFASFQLGVPQVLDSLWLYPDTVLIISLLDYGVTKTDMVHASTIDTTKDQLQSTAERLAAIQLTKNNILKYLDHTVRNNLQRMMYQISFVKQSLSTSELPGISSRIPALENTVLNIASLVNDVQVMDDMNKNIQLNVTVFDLPQVINAEIVDDIDREGPVIQRDLPPKCVIIADKDRMSQILHLVNAFQIETRSHVKLGILENVFYVFLEIDRDKFKIDMSNFQLDLKSLDDYHLVAFKILGKLTTALKGQVKLDGQGIRFLFPLEVVTVVDSTAMYGRDDYNLARGILVVDDSSINRKLMKKLIMTCVGNSLQTLEDADNGQNAIELMERKSETGQVYKLVFMDVMMPIMDGIEASRRIKARWPDVIVILVTANEEPVNAGKYDGYLQKPCTKSAIHAILKLHNFI